MSARNFWGNLFPRLARSAGAEIDLRASFAERYGRHDEVNFTAIFAAKLATLALSEGSLKVEGDSPRARLLNGAARDLWREMYRICARMLGIGGAVAVPYVKGGRLKMGVVPQECMVINRMAGDTVQSVTLLSETLVRDGDTYFRRTDYTLEGGACVITNTAAREGGTRDILREVPEWAGITPEIRLNGCDKLPLGFFISPTDARGNAAGYGVPVTFGCEGLIDEICETRRQLRREYADKRVRLGVDERMFARGEEVSDLYLKLHGVGDGTLFETFSPEIREGAYHNRLNELYILLEKAVGTSRGIISDQPAASATATGIKRANADTIAFLEKVRASLERGVRDFMRGCDALADFFALSRAGEYQVVLDWYDPFEDPSEQWKRLVEAKELGAAEAADLVRWLFPTLSEDGVNAKLERIRGEAAADTLFEP